MDAWEEGPSQKRCFSVQVRDAGCRGEGGLAWAWGALSSLEELGGPGPPGELGPVGRDVPVPEQPPQRGWVPGAGGRWQPSHPGPCPPKQLPLCRGLSPFLLTCAVYFLLWIPQDQPSWISALVKCLPVLCLVAFLQAARSARGYRALLQAALLCSAAGDACLLWPEAFLCGEGGA